MGRRTIVGEEWQQAEEETTKAKAVAMMTQGAWLLRKCIKQNYIMKYDIENGTCQDPVMIKPIYDQLPIPTHTKTPTTLVIFGKNENEKMLSV